MPPLPAAERGEGESLEQVSDRGDPVAALSGMSVDAPPDLSPPQMEAITAIEDRNIPEELIINEILVRLPLKSLIRCRSVCKAFRSAGSKRHLIELHKLHSQSKVHLLSRIQSALPGASCINIERLTEEGEWQHYYRLPCLEGYRIVNSSNDLIVLSYTDGYLLSNPATQDLVYLPRPSWDSAEFALTGFGFVSSIGKYKVVNMTSRFQDACEVLTVGIDDTWRKGLSPPSSLYTCGHTPYVDGKLHVLSYDDGDANAKLVLFNLEKEAWSVMALPDDRMVYHSHIDLREIQSLLSYICCIPEKKISIWMLRDHANEVWSKDFVIDLTLEESFAICGEYYGCFPLEMKSDGRILLQIRSAYHRRWFDYDPRDGTIQLAKGGGFSTAIYAENLVPILGF